MRDVKEEIKHRLGIVEVISAYIKLQKAGTNYKALCPFHSEKTPSFTVSPEKDMWYCFGCGEGGDLFSFIQKIEGVEFVDALRMMAEKAGVELRPEDRQVSSKRNKLLQIMELSTKFFEKQRETAVGKKVDAYLASRGLENKTIFAWRLGYAPDRWDGLYAFLTSRGFTNADIEDAGLTIKSEKTKDREYHDRFRHRIMFPIFNVQGQVIGFSGRLFEAVPGKTAGKDAGKYINTPNTSLYDKSRVLYGLDRAKVAIKKEESCVLVEGNLDVILVHQAGTEHAVAPCGTAVGSDHFQTIKRYTENVSLCFDSDRAGIKATKKSAHTALSQGLNVSVIELPKEKDAADVIKEGVGEWQKRLSSPVSFITFVMRSSKDTHDITSAKGKKEYAREVLSTIRAVSSPLEQEHWIHELAGEVGISDEVLKEEMASLPAESIEAPVPAVHVSPEEAEETPHAQEAYFVSLALKDPETFRKLPHDDFDMLFESERLRATVHKLSEGLSPQDVVKEDDALKPLMFAAELLETILEPEEIPHELERVLGYLKKSHTHRALEAIQRDLQYAEKAQDTEKVAKLLGEFHTLSQELTRYEPEAVRKRFMA